jgi:hypothetical protein
MKLAVSLALHSFGTVALASGQTAPEDDPVDVNVYQSASAATGEPIDPTQATQIGDILPRHANAGETASPASLQVTDRRATAPVVDIPQNQVSAASNGGAPAQISTSAQSGGPVPQLSEIDIEATLAQLSEAERQVLLYAIKGTDICNNPPQIAAVRELCRTRIETRSKEFTAAPRNTLTAEERLLGSSLDDQGASGLETEISRLARNTGKADNLDAQAIASVALGTNAPTLPDEPDPASSLSAETQALINALVEQLGGPGSTGQPQ